MKTTFKTIIALAILFTSCSEEAKTEDDANGETPIEVKDDADVKVVEEEVLQPEGTAVEGDDRYQYLSDETTTSDCYIVDYFIDMDIEYITVDFVTYELDEDSENPDFENYKLVNDNPKLRTFMVVPEYQNCARDAAVTTADLIKVSKENPQTIFRLETSTGMVTELFIDVCSG